MILHVDFSSDTPLYQQLRDQIVVGIAEGRLSPGEQLPTIRALAEESGINMMTVSKAYQLLKQEGYMTTDRRSGARVAASGKVTVSETVRKELKVRISELRLSGLSKEEILELCAEVYEEGETK